MKAFIKILYLNLLAVNLSLNLNDKPKLKSSVKVPQKIIKVSENFAKNLFDNPFTQTLSNTYEFFYTLPRRNLLYDIPPLFWVNNTAQYIQWYQWPHNLPPNEFVGGNALYPEDFFCYGLPGNTLPLGNWDPFGLQLVNKKMVRKYRESELKQGRLAMLASIAIILQENYHPFHPEIGGLAITQMASLFNIPLEQNIIAKILFSTLKLFSITFDSPMNIHLPLDYIAVWLFLISFEANALKNNYIRWKRNEYHHQFDHNIGIANLRDDYENGNYGFDPLNLFPDDKVDGRDIIERELNNGRLAMIAVIGMIGQEYITGLPVLESLNKWLTDS